MNIRIARNIVIILLVSVSFLSAEMRIRPDNWAQPVIGSSLKNLHKLDDRLYRSEQLTKDDFKLIQEFGIKTIINLRHYHTDNDETQGLSLQLFHHKTKANTISYADLVKALRIIKNEEPPILIHCKHGSDRTGAVCAAYRIVFHNWSNQEAVDEMIHGGYGFHSIFDNIPKLIYSIDAEKLKKDVLN